MNLITLTQTLLIISLLILTFLNHILSTSTNASDSANPSQRFTLGWNEVAKLLLRKPLNPQGGLIR